MCCKICLCLRCRSLGFFFILRGVWLGTAWCCWINLSVPFPPPCPALSLRTCHTVTDCTAKHRAVFQTCLACLGMPCEMQQDVASCGEQVVCAQPATPAAAEEGNARQKNTVVCSSFPLPCAVPERGHFA